MRSSFAVFCVMLFRRVPIVTRALPQECFHSSVAKMLRQAERSNVAKIYVISFTIAAGSDVGDGDGVHLKRVRFSKAFHIRRAEFVQRPIHIRHRQQ
mmetsp:Transcript_78772/g.213286  ORF Transcript_78772/g.213286 Transcript_78772/m.213286 type:complete len:97 (-) Transcript_78772:453-743(-)